MNHASLVGYLTDNVTVNHTKSGTPVANITLAIDRPFKSKDGKSHADFPDVVVWGKSADNLKKYEGEEGDQIGIDGRIQTRSYTNKENEKVYVTEIIADRDGLHLLNHKSSSKNSKKDTSNKNSDEKRFKKLGISDDDLPF